MVYYKLTFARVSHNFCLILLSDCNVTDYSNSQFNHVQ